MTHSVKSYKEMGQILSKIDFSGNRGLVCYMHVLSKLTSATGCDCNTRIIEEFCLKNYLSMGMVLDVATKTSLKSLLKADLIELTQDGCVFYKF